MAQHIAMTNIWLIPYQSNGAVWQLFQSDVGCRCPFYVWHKIILMFVQNQKCKLKIKLISIYSAYKGTHHWADDPSSCLSRWDHRERRAQRIPASIEQMTYTETLHIFLVSWASWSPNLPFDSKSTMWQLAVVVDHARKRCIQQYGWVLSSVHWFPSSPMMWPIRWHMKSKCCSMMTTLPDMRMSCSHYGHRSTKQF